jgi:Xaa-Pro aminopeptidase/Xaa-Pro dipeptidase
MRKRIAKLHAFLTEQNLDCVLISKPENRRYFSGFTGSAGMLLIGRETNQLFTDFRYIEQATQQAPLCEIIRHAAEPLESVAKAAEQLGVVRVGFESDFATYDVYNKLKSFMKNTEWVPVAMDALRMVKDEEEINTVKKAVEIADKAFQQVLSVIKTGVTEWDIAVELEYQMHKLGSKKPAFDTIVASGKRGALPHGTATDKKVETGELITMDFGAVYEGYHSDMTRTVCVGRASDKQKEVYNTVLNAQLAGIRAVQPGFSGRDIDAVSRKIIEEAGYGQYFGHGLGHGVGLAIHEEPRLSPSSGAVVLEPGMLVTMEPGIYLPEWGGVRIEDIVLVSANGCEILTSSSKQLIELI